MTNPGNKKEPYTPQDWSLNNIVEQLIAERCAPLVEFATYVSRVWEGAHLGDSARAALAAFRAAQKETS